MLCSECSKHSIAKILKFLKENDKIFTKEQVKIIIECLTKTENSPTNDSMDSSPLKTQNSPINDSMDSSPSKTQNSPLNDSMDSSPPKTRNSASKVNMDSLQKSRDSTSKENSIDSTPNTRSSTLKNKIDSPSKARSSTLNDKIDSPSKARSSTLKNKIDSPSKARSSTLRNKIDSPSKARNSDLNEKMDSPPKTPKRTIGYLPRTKFKKIKEIEPHDENFDSPFLRKRPNSKVQQKRNIWTLDEEDALYEGCKKYGTGQWRLIRGDFEVLQNRSVQNLYDKWRNMSKGDNMQYVVDRFKRRRKNKS